MDGTSELTWTPHVPSASTARLIGKYVSRSESITFHWLSSSKDSGLRLMPCSSNPERQLPWQ